MLQIYLSFIQCRSGSRILVNPDPDSDPGFFQIISYFFITYIHSFHIHTIHLSIAVCWGLSPSPHRLKAQWEDPPCGAEPGIELGPALQQAEIKMESGSATLLRPRASDFQEIQRTGRTRVPNYKTLLLKLQTHDPTFQGIVQKMVEIATEYRY